MNIAVGMEAIEYQQKHVFPEALDMIFRELRQSSTSSSKDVKRIGLERLIKKHTGLNVVIAASDMYSELYTNPPVLDKSHPLIHTIAKNVLDNTDARTALGQKTVVNGWVNRKKGMVGGVFSELPVTIFVPLELIRKGSILSVGELTAVFLHEIGHGFSYFEVLGRTITTNFLIQYASKNLLGTGSDETKYKIMDAMEAQPGFTVSDREVMLRTNTVDGLATIILNDSIGVSFSELGENIYDPRGGEALADQYASMYGRGRDLATAIDRLTRAGLDYTHWWKVIHWYIQGTLAINFIYVLLASPLIWTGVFAGVALIFTEIGSSFDRPVERYENIINDLRLAIRKEKNKVKRKAMLDDIDQITILMNNSNDNISVLEFMSDNLFPRSKGRAKSKDLQRMMERMVQSPLYESRERLDQLL